MMPVEFYAFVSVSAGPEFRRWRSTDGSSGQSVVTGRAGSSIA